MNAMNAQPVFPMTTNLFRIAISIGVSMLTLALLSALVLSGHDPANRPHILELLGDTLPKGVALYLVLHVAGLVLRAMRYSLLIRGAGAEAPGMGHMFLVTAFRSMMVDMLPARTGELAYAAMLNRAYRVPIPACLSSLGLAMVFDFVALALIIVLAIPAFALSGGFEPWLFGALIMAVLAAGISVAGVLRVLPWMVAWLSAGGGEGRLGRWRRALGSALGQLDDAVRQTRATGNLGRILGLSVLIRCCKYIGLFFLFLAVALPSFPELAEVSRGSVFAAMVGAELGAALPIPAFMSFGTYEAGGTLVFTLLGISGPDALLTLLSVHIWSQAVDYSLGGLCLVLVILLVRRKQPAASQPPGLLRRLVVPGFAGVILLAGAASLAWQYRANLKLGAVKAPPVGEDLRPRLADDVQRSSAVLAASGLDGFVTWSSNRFGNHDILRLSLPDGKISRLTRHPHTETYPRISPDGRRLVFQRSRKPWVSQRNTVAWDVILLDLHTGRERTLNTESVFPFWIDGNTVGYLKNGVTVLGQNVRNDEVHEIFHPGKGNRLRRGTPLQTPYLNPETNQLVFTAKQAALDMNTGHVGTAIWQNEGDGSGPIRNVLDGCEITWSSDWRSLYQVGHGGKQKTMFYRIDPQTLESTPLLDLPGDYSHEYWPKDSNDGKWMVFGASTGGHEHDVADYEMFLWEIGAPAESATRLTFHSGNDNWPDVYINQ